MMCLQWDHCELTGATKQEQIRQICQTDFKLCNVASTWNPFEWMQMSFVRCEEPLHWIMNESAPPKAQQWKGTNFSDWTQEACIMYHSGPVRWNAVCDLVSRLSVHLHLSHCPPSTVFSLAHRKFVSFVLAFPKYKSPNQTKSVVRHKWSPSSVKTCGWTCGIDFSLELMGAETEAVNYWAKCFSLLARRYRSLHLACCKLSPIRTFPVTSFINYANFISLCLFSPHGILSKINILKMHLKEFTAEVF